MELKESIFLDHQVGVSVFALGFIAAALSSMLTVALGASITADAVYSDHGSTRKEPSPSENDGQSKKLPSDFSTNLNISQDVVTADRKLPRWAFQGMMWVMVIISTTVVGANGEFI